MALGMVMRAQAMVAKPIEVAFWQSLIVAAFLALGAPWFAEIPDAAHWPMIALAAFFTVLSLLALGWAYQHAPASFLAPTEYTSLVWAAILGWIIFAEPLSPWTVGGAALIIGGSVIAARGKPVIEAAP